jgi:hypothetical protein
MLSSATLAWMLKVVNAYMAEPPTIGPNAAFWTIGAGRQS